MAKYNAQCTIHNAQRKYIDVDKFAEKICNFQQIEEDTANKMIFLLRTFPAADVEEVKHGEWKLDKYVMAEGQIKIPIEYACSLCGGKMVFSTYPYCPYCGAKMRGDAE